MQAPTRSLIYALCFSLSACGSWFSSTDKPITTEPGLSAALLAETRSGPELTIKRGQILTDNDDAFDIKLKLVQQAASSIDLAYYIFADDYSSSLMALELLAATKRGVKVRLLLDYHSHYQNFNYFRALEHYGNQDTGSFSIKFYNRPSKNIIKDAVYMTLGCRQEDEQNKAGCTREKFQEIEALFANEVPGADTTEHATSNISNINTGNSGLFLSGLYAKNPELMAMAVSRGQDIDVAALQGGAGDTNPEDAAKLKELAKLYWLANYGSGLDRLINRVKLSAAFLFYGDQVDPVYDAFSAFLPVERSKSASEENLQEARNDWQYLTDFLHHKLLLVDKQELVLGGRNVQDAYHMNANPLSDKYTFMDTDVYVQFQDSQDALTDSFEKLWHFNTMVASLQDIQAHAPIDFLVNSTAAKKVCEPQSTGEQTAHQRCLDIALQDQGKIPELVRYQDAYEQILSRADTFLSEYVSMNTKNRSPGFELDQTAQLEYFENLPFDKSLPQAQKRRYYGARNGDERINGKNIHALWLAAMQETCNAASEDTPQTIYMHNAYFFLPSNLLSAIAQMIDGSQLCAYVDIVILSNSIETTDLNVVNVLSRHSMKALFEHYAAHHDPDKGATLNYFEYQQQSASDNQSLHSKVMIFGNSIFIGSANADLRSYMMDTNNGLLIRQTPEMLDNYTQWLSNIVNDESRSNNRNDYYRLTEHSLILDAGDQLVDAELAKYRAERFINDPGQIVEIKTRLRDASNEVYRLSKQIVADPVNSTDAQALFNRLFKAI